MRQKLGNAVPPYVVLVLLMLIGSYALAEAMNPKFKGYGITRTGLIPRYPAGFACSRLTSLYASWTDVDGSRRESPHSGVDGGRLNDLIRAPGPGVIKAVWRANWGWGPDASLLIEHARANLNLHEGSELYYSEFDHLRYDDISHFKVGQTVARGEPLAHVSWPGGDARYEPEVHWEVWEVGHDVGLGWFKNQFGGLVWWNDSAELIDPLFMLAQDTQPDHAHRVAISPFVLEHDYSQFRGFTYILPCEPRGKNCSHRERTRP